MMMVLERYIRDMKIKKIELLNVDEPAYDITVADDAHTFPLDAGVFVHNSMRIPKQYFGETDENAGFSGGQSLSIISARYAKMIKRIQNTMVQALTDAINLMLLDKGLNTYVNKFDIRMLPPTTQEEIDRRENVASKVGIAQDIMNTLSDIDDQAAKLKILKSLLSNIVPDTDIVEILQEQIDKIESAEEEMPIVDEPAEEDAESDQPISSSSSTSTGFEAPDTETDSSDENTGEENNQPGEAGEEASDETVLPLPNELGADFTDSTQF